MKRDDSETKIEVERRDGRLKTIISAPMEEELERAGVRTCCRIYIGDATSNSFSVCK